MENYAYGELIKSISKVFEEELNQISAVYNFDYGDEFELAVCKVLKRILPLKYGVCRGFVVDKNGAKAGDDIIIYDRLSYPDFRFDNHKDSLSRKSMIPVDAVYAYIEAKHTLTAETLSKAFKQVTKVKQLCYTRGHLLHPAANATLGCDQNHVNGLHVFDNDYSRRNGWNPIVTTPVYGMILSRYCSPDRGDHFASASETTNFIVEQINDTLSHDVNKYGINCPDAIIAGNSSTGFCGHYQFGPDGKLLEEIQITRFFTGVKPYSCYQINSHEGEAFGLGIAHLLLAMSYIKLKEMPWDHIFNTRKMPDEKLRMSF